MLYRLILSHLNNIKNEELNKILDSNNNNTVSYFRYHMERVEALCIAMHIISEKEDMNRVKEVRLQRADAGSYIFDKSAEQAAGRSGDQPGYEEIN